MKEYQYEGRTYVESGEVRVPSESDFYISAFGDGVCGPNQRGAISMIENDGKRKILIPKEDKMNEEYNIPVLLLVNPKRTDPNIQPYLGKVVMCRQEGRDCYTGPAGVKISGASGSEYSHVPTECIPWPTREQVEAEQAKLKPKADPLPSALDNFLNTPNGNVCEGVRKWAREFATLIYANPPKAKE